jgi:hypothetical protein
MDIDSDLHIQMQSLTMNDILHQNLYQEEEIHEDEIDEIDEISDTSTTENIIADMQMLSIAEKDILINDLFVNNLDIYSIYSELITISKRDPTEYDTDVNSIYNKYNFLRVIGVPNIYCDGEDFDDEDFIYNRFKLSEYLSHLVQNDNTVQEIDNNVINFADTIISPENVYYKILYIYQFVHYFNTTLSSLKFKKRILHLPYEFLLWVDNIVCIIKNTINMADMNTTLCVYQNTNHVNFKNVGQYFKDMVYGMSLCICHLKMTLNHHQIREISFWDMEEKYIDKFFRVLNNLCIMVIYMKHGF